MTTNSIDPKHEQLHRVRVPDLEKYKAEVVKEVTAVCGKTWAPTIPIDRFKQKTNCPVCFPTDQYRFAIAN